MASVEKDFRVKQGVILGNGELKSNNPSVTLFGTGVNSISIGGGGTTTSVAGSLSSASVSITGGSINGTTIGGTTRAAGSFTTLSANGAVTLDTGTNNQSITTTGAGTITITSGTAGNINNMNIGATTRGTGAFTTLAANSTVSLATTTAAQTYSTTTGNISFNTTTTGSISLTTTAGQTGTITINSAGATGSINNMAIGATTRATGQFTTLAANNAVTLTAGANNSSFTTTGAGTITISSGTTGSIENFNIGATSAGTGRFTTLESTGNLTVGGNLVVNGTTTTINSTTTTLDDPIITLGGDTAPTVDDNKDRGVEFRYFNGSAKVGFFGFDDSTGFFTFIPDASNSAEVFSGAVGDIQAGNFRGNLIGGTVSATTGTFSGDVAVNGGDVTTTSTTASIFNTNATSVSIAGAADTVTIGSPLSTVTLSGDLSVSGGDIVLDGTGRIQGIDTVTAPTDAASKQYVDTAVANATPVETTTTLSAPGSIFTMSSSVYRSAKLVIQASHATAGFQVQEVLLTHTGTDVHYTETNDIFTVSSLFDVTIDITGGNVVVTGSPVNSNTTFKVVALTRITT